jgi:hypothetical protein
MSPRDVLRATGPLALIFWGGLLCVFDLTFTQTTNGQGFKCDVLNDAVGTLLIAVGVSRLAALPVPGRYRSAMRFVQLVAILAVLNAVRAHFVVPLPAAVQAALALFGLVTLAAIVTFCVAMRWLCEHAGLRAAARSWAVTTVLFVVIYLLPLGGLYVVMAGAAATGREFQLKLGPAALLLVLVFAIPLIHLFVSTVRMRRAAEEAAAVKPPPDALPPRSPSGGEP